MYSLAKLYCGYNNVIKYHDKDFDYQSNAKEPLTWNTQGTRLCYLIMVQWAHVKFVNMHENGRFSLESINCKGWEQFWNNTACRIITTFIFMNNIKSTVKNNSLPCVCSLCEVCEVEDADGTFFFKWPKCSALVCVSWGELQAWHNCKNCYSSPQPAPLPPLLTLSLPRNCRCMWAHAFCVRVYQSVAWWDIRYKNSGSWSPFVQCTGRSCFLISDEDDVILLPLVLAADCWLSALCLCLGKKSSIPFTGFLLHCGISEIPTMSSLLCTFFHWLSLHWIE